MFQSAPAGEQAIGGVFGLQPDNAVSIRACGGAGDLDLVRWENALSLFQSAPAGEQAMGFCTCCDVCCGVSIRACGGAGDFFCERITLRHPCFNPRLRGSRRLLCHSFIQCLILFQSAPAGEQAMEVTLDEFYFLICFNPRLRGSRRSQSERGALCCIQFQSAPAGEQAIRVCFLKICRTRRFNPRLRGSRRSCERFLIVKTR